MDTYLEHLIDESILTTNGSVLVFNGRKGVGKSTLRNDCIEEIRWREGLAMPLPMATGLKMDAIAMGGVTVFGSPYLDNVAKGPAARHFLQTLGTERGRDLYGEDYHLIRWLCLAEMITNALPDIVLVVDDARFPNEREFFKDLGAEVFTLDRGLAPGSDTHSSETAVTIGYQGRTVLVPDRDNDVDPYSQLVMDICDTVA